VRGVGPPGCVARLALGKALSGGSATGDSADAGALVDEPGRRGAHGCAAGDWGSEGWAGLGSRDMLVWGFEGVGVISGFIAWVGG